MVEDKPPSASWRLAKRIAIGLAGGIVLLVGIAMIVLPGPAIVVIPLGLGILGLEFPFARRWLRVVREKGLSWWRRK
jgi:tellurite resistance protein TerC